jgi:beta-lactamase class A
MHPWLTLWFLIFPLLAADDHLQTEVARLARITDGVVGVTAVHIESGRRFSFHGTDRFPMASTFKVPIAVELLSRVDRGEVRLGQMVTIDKRDLHPGGGTLSNLFTKPGVALSVENLLELMLLISDNSATDVMLRLAGGPQAVTAKMHELGIKGIRIDRPTIRIIADWSGVELPPEQEWVPGSFSKLSEQVTPEQRKAANERFNQDPRDTAQPDAMAGLLERIYRRELHKRDTADLLLDIMRRCQTGESRIKGMLPPETLVAHKTGSIGGTVNDVGIVTLPDDAGHLALAILVKQGTRPEMSERATAQISRAIYDYFLFAPSEKK